MSSFYKQNIFNPFTELQRFINRPFPKWEGFCEQLESWNIPVDVVTNDEQVVVTASVPGVDSSKINAQVEDNILTISAETENSKQSTGNTYLLRERRTGSFHRSIRLPKSIDNSKVTSAYKNGILTIVLPLQESEKAHKITIS